MPAVTDLEGFTYLQREGNGVLLGVYETNMKHWATDGAPWDFGQQLLSEEIDRIAPELELAFERFPSTAVAGVKRPGLRPVHRHPGRQPARRADRRRARLLGGLRRVRGVQPVRRRGPVRSRTRSSTAIPAWTHSDGPGAVRRLRPPTPTCCR
ncbi:MAG: hypothetical protein U0838_06650 [Chloroflexota bacterium]